MSGEHDHDAARRNLRKFVETSSVRGVSRMFKSDFVVIRVIWILAVVTCTSLLIYQLRNVIFQYFRYEYATVSREDITSDTVS